MRYVIVVVGHKKCLVTFYNDTDRELINNLIYLVDVSSWPLIVGRTRYTLIDSPTVKAGKEAEDQCKNQRGTLAKVTSPSLEDSILRLAKKYSLNNKDYWIAGKNQIVEWILNNGNYWMKSSEFNISCHLNYRIYLFIFQLSDSNPIFKLL